ncbi:MAG: hypothetical protein ACI82F_004259, partial [Planctomycetota bacterium]
PDDRQLIDELHSLMASQQMDFTGLFRSLSAVTRGDRKALYDLVEQTGDLDKWLARWLTRQASEDVDPQERAAAMDRVNPLYVPRNHKVEEALEAAVAGNFTPFETLLQLLIKPHTKIDGRDDFTQPAPSGFGPYMTYCGT